MYSMFGKKKITVCEITKAGITATICSKTGKGIVVENKIENTSFQALKTEFGIKKVRILIPEQDAVDPILKLASDVGITVEVYESPSASMARMASHVHEPFLLIYPQVTPEYICAIADGKVLEIRRVDSLGSLEDTKNAFIKQVFDTQGVTIKAIATSIPDPVMGLAMKKDAEKSKKMPIPLPLIIGSIMLLVVAIGFFSVRLLRSSQKVTPQLILTPTPTPTPAPIVRSELKIEVQNGSGVVGLAGKGKKTLEDLGYIAVTTANADNYEYTGVTVKGKTTAIATFVVADIKNTYKTTTFSSTFVDKEATPDAIVILGKE